MAARVVVALERCGMRAALELLNSRARYRFSGVFRVEPTVVQSLYVFDRENPELDLSGGVLDLESSHVAVPIRGGTGRVCGALCHWDVRPRLLAAGELALLRQVAPLLGEWLAVDHGPEPSARECHECLGRIAE